MVIQKVKIHETQSHKSAGVSLHHRTQPDGIGGGRNQGAQGLLLSRPTAKARPFQHEQEEKQGVYTICPRVFLLLHPPTKIFIKLAFA